MPEICLVGNPNCGKTSLFNYLTGTYQKVGNWSGVTTEKKEGIYKANKKIKIIDLPGLYSLSAVSKDEFAVINYLKDNKNSIIVNVVDGTNLERNLFLTSKLVQLGLPMVIAVNFYDELCKNGIKLNIDALQKTFGVKIVPVSAVNGFNVNLLIDCAVNALKPNFKAIKRLSELDTKGTFNYISKHIVEFISQKQTVSQVRTLKFDKFLMGKITGIPFFVFVIFIIYCTSSKFGGFLSSKISDVCIKFTTNTALAMCNANLPTWFISLFSGAILKGVGSVLAFTPQILILFFFMTIIEESGYAARVTFLFDNLFRRIGLGGKSVIPLILSCGCTVTGILSTRTIESEKEKKITLYLAPFMPCGAKIIVFGWFSYVFFNGNPLITVSIYFLSIICIIVFGSLLNRFYIKNKSITPFILEIPTLHRPTLKNISMVLWEKTKDFTVKSGTIILSVSILTWLLVNFGLNGYTNGNVEQSFLYYLGNLLKFIFVPLGFGSWQASVALISGVFAKEAVMESILLIQEDFSIIFANKFVVYGFMAFVLLSPPCIASVSTAKKELNSKKELAKMLIFQFSSAYLVAFLINLIGIVLYIPFLLILLAVCVIITVLWAVIILLKKAKNPCYFCSQVSCGGIKCNQVVKHNTII